MSWCQLDLSHTLFPCGHYNYVQETESLETINALK